MSYKLNEEEKKVLSSDFDRITKDFVPENKIICTLEDLLVCKIYGKEKAKILLNETRLCEQKGLNYKGCVIYFDKEKEVIISKDVHVLEIKTINRRNRPLAQVKTAKGIKQYRSKYGNILVPGVTLVCGPVDLEDFIYNGTYVDDQGEHKMDFTKILYTDDCEVEEFYRIGNKTITFLTNTMRRNFMDNPSVIYKCFFNFDVTENIWGLSFPYFENLIVEYDDDAYVEDDVGKEDIDNLVKGFEDTYTAKRILKAFEIKNANNIDDFADEMVLKVNKIQDLLSSKWDEILRRTLKAFNIENVDELSSADMLNELRRIDQNSGLDCGFITYRFTNEDLDTKARKIGAKDNHKGFSYSGGIILNTPASFIQSVTIKAEEGFIIKSLVNEAGLDSISFSTRLD